MQQWCLLRFRTKLTVISGGRFIQHLLRLPMRYYAQRFSGELVGRLTMTGEISELVGGQFATIALNMLMVVFFGILLFSYSVPLAIICVATLVLNITVVKLMSRYMSDRNQVSAQAQGKLLGTSIGGIQTIENIKGGGTEDDFFARWSGFQARYLIEKQSLLLPTQITSLFPELMNDLASAIILTWGAFLIMQGNLTIGTLVAFQGLFAQFNAPVTALVQFDNLSLWDHTIPNKDLLQASRDAEIAEVIMSRPGGFDAEIGEGGANFSGGQRQRLELARALAVRPTILVLDEATSALDATTEAQIDGHLRRRGCSCLIVAHRLSTIRDADEIIVMERGKVVERGTYEQLMSSNGSFKALMEA